MFQTHILVNHIGAGADMDLKSGGGHKVCPQVFQLFCLLRIKPSTGYLHSSKFSRLWDTV